MRGAPTVVLALAVAVIVGLPASARADEDPQSIGQLGRELTPRRLASPRADTEVVLDGSLRLRGELLHNLDLDRGLTPSGQSLFPVPLADPSAQTLAGGDARLRTDLAIFAPGSGVAVKLRVDVLDNLGLGSTPEGRPGTSRAPTPAASPGQSPPAQALRIKRAYGEVLTPFGLLAAGRMGAHWGLGMVANSGDCDDCDSGDAADRIAFVTPIAGHLWALAFDISATGPIRRRRDQARVIDLDPTDDVRTVTFAILDENSPLTRLRLRQAGRSVLEYGAYVSHRWQQNDVPADYLPTARPVPIDPAQVVQRGYRATAVDAWLRLTMPQLSIEAEAAYVDASIDQPSLVPGVELDLRVTSRQLGAALKAQYTGARDRVGLGLGAGYASGDSAPGFGAFPEPGAPAGQPGDVDAPQAHLPRDTTVDNFRFHPDYRVDRILFREIIGTVTDAVYLRPSGRYRLFDLGHGQLDADLAAIASWAVEAASTPSGERFLGVEADPSLVYRSRDGFRLALEYAVFVPGVGFDNTAAGLDARAAQLLRARMGFHF